MKTHSVLYSLAVWALTTTASYGQNNAIETGSAEAERALREFKAGSTNSRSTMREGYLPREPRDWATGDIGLLGRNAKVIQVIGKDKALISVSGLEVSSLSRLAMLSGFSTKGMTDGSVWTIDEPVEITGTTAYTAVNGSTNTVLVLECNSSKIKEIKAKLEADKEAQRKAAIERAKAKERRKAAFEAAKWRAWTISDGTEVDARFGGTIGSTVLLTKRDGSKLKIPLADLSADDREWIAKRRE